ncbi:alpha/beta fold hydrolase [Saccharopolyspora sp. NPDC047091]|uniref:alpha/beta fold hydrolase n=1 Tax=Saccharopolyspora sp. NPDC047091 TaxID=3155924 RepID=UPI0033FC1238
MPFASVNGVRLHYDEFGAGEPVLLIMGSGGRGRAWHLHQVPALRAAGYRVVTFDNRGIAPSDLCADGFTVRDMVGDVVGLIEHLGLESVRVVGTSMGSYIAQELVLARPDLVRQAVLMATRGRTDRFRAALSAATRELHRSGAVVPSSYSAVTQAMQVLSPATLARDQDAADWLDLLELAPPPGPGELAQLALEPMPDRLEAYRAIEVRCHVVSFSDDLLTPARHGRELAEIIPGATYECVADAGHYGYLEVPETVNKSILEFFRSAR